MSLVMLLMLPAEAYASNEGNVSSPAVQSASVKNGLVKEKNRYCYYENGKKVKKAWRKIDGEMYYFYDNGYAITTCINLNGIAYVFDRKGRRLNPRKSYFYTYGGNTFYVDTKGRAKIGWFEVNGKLYCADKKGRLYKNKTFEGIVFSSTGTIKVNTASKLKLKTMRIVNEITTPQMSRSQKLRACWNYLVYSGRFRYRGFEEDTQSPGWQKNLAYDMLSSYSGNCTSFAVAFAALADQLGYDPYVLYTRIPGGRDQAPDGLTRHCWVTINGKHYDPEGTWAGWISEVYGMSYYPLYYQTLMNFKYATGK